MNAWQAFNPKPPGDWQTERCFTVADSLPFGKTLPDSATSDPYG